MFTWLKRGKRQDAESKTDEMRPELAREVQALREFMQSCGMELPTAPGASEQEVREVEARLGIRLDPALRDLYLFSNGCDATWFAVMSDEVTPCTFVSLQDALEAWSWFEPYDEAAYRQWADKSPKHDPRIKPFLHHKAWFPFAEFNGFSTAVYFDADPTRQGNYGQIIVYQHDPDGIYYVARNFLDFFALSNKLLAENADTIFGEK
jgi:cell wall assembly regulator SMI1